MSRFFYTYTNYVLRQGSSCILRLFIFYFFIFKPYVQGGTDVQVSIVDFSDIASIQTKLSPSLFFLNINLSPKDISSIKYYPSFDDIGIQYNNLQIKVSTFFSLWKSGIHFSIYLTTHKTQHLLRYLLFSRYVSTPVSSSPEDFCYYFGDLMGTNLMSSLLKSLPKSFRWHSHFFSQSAKPFNLRSSSCLLS